MQLRDVRSAKGWKVEIVKDECSIARLWIADRQMRIGPCPVLTAGIAGVGTDPEYRGQGLARRVLEASLELMQREGYDASMLFGIQDFYHKFGFATCFPERQLSLDTRDAERAEKQLAIRSMRPDDLPHITRLYNRDNAERTGSVVRDSTWRGFAMGSDFGVETDTKVVLNVQGRIGGYVVCDKTLDRCRAAEVGGRTEAVFSTILHFLARRSVQLRREEISLALPIDHLFARYCQSYGCRGQTRFIRNAGPKGRITQLQPFLDKILPVLAERWGQQNRERALALTTDIGTSVLRWRRGRLATDKTAAKSALNVRVGQDALMLLAMGYHPADDLRTRGALNTNKEALAILARLFPLQTAHMAWPDRF